MGEIDRKTAWMWLSGDSLRGLSMDPAKDPVKDPDKDRDERTLTWIWQAGCHCADEDAIVQSVQQYLKEGPPSLIGPLPPDVAQEVGAALAQSTPPSRRAAAF